jgi:uncharacterized protein involved in exopolysaccharide biosynthesis
MTPGHSSALPSEDIPLLRYWLVIRKHQWLVIGLFFVAVVTAMVVSLLLPKVYESTATILPPTESRDAGGLNFLAASKAAELGMALPGMPATKSDIFVAMLKSRVMADAVITRFDLKRVYKAKAMQDARKALEAATKINVGREKVIRITVEDRDPARAADIANFYCTNLDRLNRTVHVTSASHNRAFIERRLAETQVSLIKAEETLKEFQTANKTVAVEAQSKVMIEAAAVLQGQIMAHEVQLKVMSGYLSPDNPELARLRSALDELKKQLYVMESGTSGKGMLPGDRLHPAMITVPSLSLDYGRLMRELKVQETVYQLLTSQYEQAKLAEARDTPTVQVLDPAIPAERKSRPKIRQNMMLAGVLALAFGIALAFFLEYRERMKAYANFSGQRLDRVPSLEAKVYEGQAEHGGSSREPSKDS